MVHDMDIVVVVVVEKAMHLSQIIKGVIFEMIFSFEIH